MPSLSSLKLKTSYKKTTCDIAEDFYKICMKNSTRYDRLSGYFSSSIYYIIWDALQPFILNNGKIRIVCSPNLSNDDKTALTEGEKSKSDKILADSLNKTFIEMLTDEKTVIPAKLLACLVSNGTLDIKLAILPEEHALFHDKVGTFRDGEGNIVGFRGAMNETYKGLAKDGNIESIDVYANWEGERDAERAQNAQEAFEEIWNDSSDMVLVYTLPESIKHKFLEISKENTIPELMGKLKNNGSKKRSLDSRKLRDHQEKALDDWERNNRRGILEHATGSGKTFTAITAIRRSLEKYNEVPLILVPSSDLLKQWISELNYSLNDLNPLILPCDGQNKKWKNQLSQISKGSSDNIKKPIIVATLQTASTSLFLKELSDGPHIFLVADEVHRCGSSQFRSVFTISSGPRLGLSATPKRYGDSEGTNAIYQYFERTIIPTYSLEDAIKDKHLSPYYYYPYMVELTEGEQEEWLKLSNEVRKKYAIIKNKKDTANLVWGNSSLKKILIERSRILKKAGNKIPCACEILHNYADGDKWLVYCDSLEQLNELKAALAKDPSFYGVTILSYHSKMNSDERTQTLSAFSQISCILLSVKCLDEGVNIPSASHALILASSKNPREFIQRRGRILRTHNGKIAAYLYDVIVSPIYSDKDEDTLISITKTELKRAIEFAEMAENRIDCMGRLKSIAIENNVNLTDIDEFGYDEEEEEYE